MDQRTQRIYDLAKAAARNATTIPYSFVASVIGLDMDNPVHRNELAAILDEVSRTEHTRGRPMLSAVVVHTDDLRPGQGFFTLAEDLGEFDGTDEETFFLAELKRVHEAWQT